MTDGPALPDVEWVTGRRLAVARALALELARAEGVDWRRLSIRDFSLEYTDGGAFKAADSGPTPGLIPRLEEAVSEP